LVETVAIAPPGDRKAEQAAYREAQKVLTRLQGEADSLKVARTKSTFGALLDRWLPQHEVDATTRMNYESVIRQYIRPALGDVPLLLLTRDASERLERFYADLRRCSQRCNGRPFIEHRVEGPHESREVRHRRPPGRRPAGGYPEHDCAEAGCTVIECRQHECRPYSASSVRQVHAIISGTLSAAVRWGWIAYNPAPAVRLPTKPRPQPRPPSSADMARIVEPAYLDAEWWGTYMWLSAVIGARRGEVVALQWEDIDLEAGTVVLDENYVRGPGGMLVKDVAKPDLSVPRDPSSLTRRYSRLVAELGITTQLKELRHYSATELAAHCWCGPAHGRWPPRPWRRHHDTAALRGLGGRRGPGCGQRAGEADAEAAGLRGIEQQGPPALGVELNLPLLSPRAAA
jgi:integrase